MIIISQVAELPYSPPQIFEVVNDIQAYPEFLPFCKKGTVEIVQKDKVVKGSLTIGGLGFSETFKTCNTLIKPNSIKIELIEGPLDYLEGNWTFTAMSSTKTQAKLHLTFHFKYPWLERLTKPILNKVTQETLEAFEKRLAACYKEPKQSSSH